MRTSRELLIRTARTREDKGTLRDRRPWWVWAVPAIAILATLLARNSQLFTGRFYEGADYGADSILVEQARHFTLLVGNYSRDLFNHPGPAYLYVQAAGQTLLYNALHVVPTAWNGQVIGLYVLDSLLAGLAVFVVYGWAGYRGALAATAVLLGFAVLHTGVLSAAWLPYQDVPAFALFLLAAASVAAGRGRDAWIAALAGWLLIHRYAVMLMFVPVLTLVVIALGAWPRRHKLRAALGELWRTPAVWVPVAVISAVFALPIAAEQILHWPGQFGKYLTYTRGSSSGHHGAAATVRYVTWFWGPGAVGWAVLAALTAAAILAMLWTGEPLTRYLAALLVLGGVATVLFCYYAANGVDEIDQQYIGYFYWAVPMAEALVVVLAVLAALPWPRVVAVVTAGAAVAALATFAVVPGTQISTTHVDPEFATGPGAATDPAIPHAVRTVAAHAHGATIVVYLYQAVWPAMTGFLVQAERTGVHVCLASPWWSFMVTNQFICTQAQAAHGTDVLFGPAEPGARDVIARLGSVNIVSYAPAT